MASDRGVDVYGVQPAPIDANDNQIESLIGFSINMNMSDLGPDDRSIIIAKLNEATERLSEQTES
ncbi:hypothetical protein HQ531_12415 [bacterium]|nr:hypothetical protein [bacterium]